MKASASLSRRKFQAGLGLSAVAFSTAAFAQIAAPNAAIAGTWSSVPQPGSKAPRLELIVGRDGTVKVVHVDVGRAIAVPTKFAVTADSVSFEESAVATSFKGSLTDANTLQGALTQFGRTSSIKFVRGDLYPADDSRRRAIAAIDGPLSPQTLAALRTAAGLPALGAAWSIHDDPRLLVDGLRSVASNEAVQGEDRWQLGSITKSFTATLVARLVEAGFIGWNDTVGQHLAHDAATIRPSYRNATFVHLLSHTAGLLRDIAPGDARQFRRGPLDDPRQERHAYALLGLKHEAIAKPGERSSYSNLGYVVAAAMLEARMHAPWEALMIEWVIAPLSLHRYSLDYPYTPTSGQPVGHHYDPSHKLIPAGAEMLPPVAAAPAGSVSLSLGDLMTYLRAHRTAQAGFLTPQSWNVLHTRPFAQAGNYALGWDVNAAGRLSHAGAIGGWLATVAIDPVASAQFAGVTNALTPDAAAALSRAEALALPA